MLGSGPGAWFAISEFLKNPPPEKNPCIRIRHTGSHKPLILWTHALILKLDIIIHHYMRKHQLEFACREVLPGTGVPPMAETKQVNTSGHQVKSPSRIILFFEFEGT